MTNDEQIIKAALDMAAMAAVTTPESRPGAPREWSDGFTSGCLHSADAIRAIDPADVLAKVGVTSTNLEPPRLMAMCGHCRSAGEEYCVQYLKDLRWDGAEWCCKDCFDGSGENGEWDEATQPCQQPAPDAVARLVEAARALQPYLDWTIGPESPGYHPTMASAVAAFKEALAAMEASHDRA